MDVQIKLIKVNSDTYQVTAEIRGIDEVIASFQEQIDAGKLSPEAVKKNIALLLLDHAASGMRDQRQRMFSAFSPANEKTKIQERADAEKAKVDEMASEVDNLLSQM